MAEFATSFRRTLEHEGGLRLVEIEGDRGGQTYAGISRRAHPGWDGWALIDRGEPPSEEMVARFYRQHYWRPIYGDRIPDQNVADVVYDMAVHSGVRRAARILQRIVGVEPDSVIGPRTLAALRLFLLNHPAEIGTRRLIDRYTVERIAHYTRLALRERSQRRFLPGWTRRALEFVVPPAEL